MKSTATGEDRKLWYPVHAFQHTRLREFASPRQFPRLHSVVHSTHNTPIEHMIGQENFTPLTIHQPYQRQRIATVGLAVSVQGSVATSTMSDRPLNGSLLRLVELSRCAAGECECHLRWRSPLTNHGVHAASVVLSSQRWRRPTTPFPFNWQTEIPIPDFGIDRQSEDLVT